MYIKDLLRKVEETIQYRQKLCHLFLLIKFVDFMYVSFHDDLTENIVQL